LGDGDVPELAQAIRAFGNATEYVPAALIGIAVLAMVEADYIPLEQVIRPLMAYGIGTLGLRAFFCGLDASLVAFLPAFPVTAFVSIGRKFGRAVTCAVVGIVLLAFSIDAFWPPTQHAGPMLVPRSTLANVPTLLNLFIFVGIVAMSAFAYIKELDESTVGTHFQVHGRVVVERGGARTSMRLTHVLIHTGLFGAQRCTKSACRRSRRVRPKASLSQTFRTSSGRRCKRSTPRRPSSPPRSYPKKTGSS